MAETAAVPPLPPKTKQRSPLSATVPATDAVPQTLDVYHYRIQEVPDENVVKIHINPIVSNKDKRKSTTLINQERSVINFEECSSPNSLEEDEDTKNGSVVCEPACIRISVNSETEMVHGLNMETQNSPYFFYNCGMMSSGQISPSDTLDSGTCSDLDGTPPPLPKKKGSTGVSVTLIGGGHSAPSSSSGAEVDSDGESNISCDSLTSGKMSPVENHLLGSGKSSFLPQTLLQDIRQRNVKLTTPEPQIKSSTPVIDEKSYEERIEEEKTMTKNNKNKQLQFDADMFYNFHINEHQTDADNSDNVKCVVEDETFAGYKDLLGDGAATIRSAKGTVRGVKNRVRAGIATFLQINSTSKNYKEKEAGKVVVYTTTMGILRDTYQACMKVKQILRTLLVKFEERDVFMSSEYQSEIQERMHCEHILVPQVFVDGQHVGDAETIERLNESGELRRIMKPFKSIDACSTCKSCGGYRLLPCQVCNGSKKSVHRNHFTAEFVALKCMNCDEVGLVRCPSC
ncbi:glutaredoxin domain-containing cysteine-rich protein CG31559-like isoform X2 [Aethina tumida]|nr:glutaredoxin domain-containing cysteine-rich protein CG31559-like isoform X2 [Aethina tumida]